jgi:hypothetical protein
MFYLFIYFFKHGVVHRIRLLKNENIYQYNHKGILYGLPTVKKYKKVITYYTHLYLIFMCISIKQ